MAEEKHHSTIHAKIAPLRFTSHRLTTTRHYVGVIVDLTSDEGQAIAHDGIISQINASRGRTWVDITGVPRDVNLFDHVPHFSLMAGEENKVNVSTICLLIWGDPF